MAEPIMGFTAPSVEALDPLLQEGAFRQGRYVHSFLSNFYPARVRFDGDSYESVEHAYQAAKFLDPRARERIAVTPSPGAAKRAAVHMRRNVRADWRDVNLAVMKSLVIQKFALYDEFRARLVETGARELVEANTWGDDFFGKVWAPDRQRWIGENHLGRILMEVRSLMLRDPGSLVPSRV